MSSVHRLEPLFKFSSIAVIGATDGVGYGSRPYRVLQDLGFTGQYFPVNPRRELVHGLRAYPDVSSLPTPVDAAMIVVGRDQVLPIVQACADKGARAVVIVTSGFAEADEHGRDLQAKLAALAQERQLLVIGPNCVGLASIAHRCAAFGMPVENVRPGNVAVVSNSGGLLIEIITYGTARGLGFSHLVSTGNEAVVSAADVLDYVVDDPSTDLVLAILETVRDPELFMKIADRATAARKPIVILKLGASAKGAESTFTHTGALSGSDAVYDAVFRQKGVIRVHDLDELIDMGVLLSGAVPVLRRRLLERAGVIEISGGGKGLVCDTAAACGVELPSLSEQAVAMIQPSMPPSTKADNPLDTGIVWGSPEMARIYPSALRVMASEPTIDVLVSRYNIPRTGGIEIVRQALDNLKTARTEHPDRLFVVLSRSSDQYSEEWGRALRDERIVFLQGYGRAMRALGRMAAYSRYLGRHAASGREPDRAKKRAGAPVPSEEGAAVGPEVASSEAFLSDTGWAKGLMARSILSETDLAPRAAWLRTSLPDRVALDEVESKDLVRGAGLPVIPTARARSADEAVALAEQFGYPVVAKVVSPQILHKSDVGGVLLNLPDSTAVRQAFATLQRVAASVPGAEFNGVAIQPMAMSGLELVLGAHRDPQFGPVVLFGLGGVFVEVLRDVALRVAPLSELDAREMLDDIRGHSLLDGVRGYPPVDRAAIVEALCCLSDLVLAQPTITSLDLNPVYSYSKGLLVVDARILLSNDGRGGHCSIPL